MAPAVTLLAVAALAAAAWTGHKATRVLRVPGLHGKHHMVVSVAGV